VPALSFGNVTVEQDSRDDEILTPASTLRPQDLIFTILGTYVLPALARAGAARRRPAVPRRPPLPQPQPDRLYLCGSSTHPGGNVTGMPGYIAASELAKDLGVTPCGGPSTSGETCGERWGLILPIDVGTTRRRSAGVLRFVKRCIAGDVEGRRLPSRQ
jgi:hypothetical protein